MYTLAGILGPIGTPELIILAILGLLIFGKRLPEVGRGLGKSIVEFRKGLKSVEDDIEHGTSTPAQLPERDSPAVTRTTAVEQAVPRTPGNGSSAG
jgi:sec-independent protein translocase protein TatA